MTRLRRTAALIALLAHAILAMVGGTARLCFERDGGVSLETTACCLAEPEGASAPLPTVTADDPCRDCEDVLLSSYVGGDVPRAKGATPDVAAPALSYALAAAPLPEAPALLRAHPAPPRPPLGTDPLVSVALTVLRL